MLHHTDFDAPEEIQAVYDTPADRRFRRKVWTVIACGLVAFWTVAAGVVAGVVGGGSAQ